MANEILSALLRESIAVTAAILAVLALRGLVRRVFGSRVAYALWLAVPIALLAAVAPPRTVFVAGQQAAIDSIQPKENAERADAPFTRGTTGHRRIVIGDDDLLLAAWLLGSVASIGVLLVRQRRFTRSLGPLRWNDRHRAWLAGATDACPAVLGVIWPRIVLPADFERRYSAPEQAVVLAHERAHLRGGDPQFGALAIALQTANWFNPLAHLALRYFRIDQELACDAAVIARFPKARRLYGQAMLKTALATNPVPIGCGWPANTASVLKERITAMKLSVPNRTRRVLGLGLVIVLATGAGAGAWAGRAPKQVYNPQLRSSESPSVDALGIALVEAAAQGDMRSAKKLIGAGADINYRADGDGTPLIAASRAGHLSMVELLLDGGAEIDLSVPGDGNPLIVAAAESHAGIVRLLVGRGANVDAFMPEDETPLINAVYGGSLEIVDFLVRSGADVNLTVWASTESGERELRSPLSAALRAGRLEIVAYLKAHGAQ